MRFLLALVAAALRTPIELPRLHHQGDEWLDKYPFFSDWSMRETIVSGVSCAPTSRPTDSLATPRRHPPFTGNFALNALGVVNLGRRWYSRALAKLRRWLCLRPCKFIPGLVSAVCVCVCVCVCVSVSFREDENNGQEKFGTLFIFGLDLARREGSIRSDFPGEWTPFYIRRNALVWCAWWRRHATRQSRPSHALRIPSAQHASYFPTDWVHWANPWWARTFLSPESFDTSPMRPFGKSTIFTNNTLTNLINLINISLYIKKY